MGLRALKHGPSPSIFACLCDISSGGDQIKFRKSFPPVNSIFRKKSCGKPLKEIKNVAKQFPACIKRISGLSVLCKERAFQVPLKSLEVA